MGDNNANYQRAIEASLASSAAAAHGNANLEAALAASRASANEENAARLQYGFAHASANTAPGALEDVAAEFLTLNPTRRGAVLAAYRLDDYIMAGVHPPSSPVLAEARHIRDELKRLVEGGAGGVTGSGAPSEGSDEMESMIVLATEFISDHPGVEAFPVYDRLEALHLERIAEEAEEPVYPSFASSVPFSSSSSAPYVPLVHSSILAASSNGSNASAAAIGTAPFSSSSSAPYVPVVHSSVLNSLAASSLGSPISAVDIGAAPFSSSSSSSSAAAPPLSGPALRAAMLAAAQRRMNAAASAAAAATGPRGGRRTLRKRVRKSKTRRPRRR